jgi:hypothetical protein
MTNIFAIIRNQIVSNELQGKEREFKVKFSYPSNEIVWMTTKAKAFKVESVIKSEEDGQKVYTIKYKDVNPTSQFLEKALEIGEAKQKKYNKFHEFEHLAPRQKSLAYYDKYRTELDCPNVDYKALGLDYDMLDKADDCTFELFLQKFGWDSYSEYMQFIETASIETQDRINELFEEFKEAELVPQLFVDGKATEGVLY